MATLNIKNFPESLYEQLQKQAEEEHRSVVCGRCPVVRGAFPSSRDNVPS